MASLSHHEKQKSWPDCEDGLLHRVENACSNVGIRLNAKKTEGTTFNTDHVELKTLD